MSPGELGAALGAFFVAAVAAWKAMTLRKRTVVVEHRAGSVVRTLARNAEIERVLEVHQERLQLDRLLLLVAHNGGPQIERAATQLYVTVCGEAQASGVAHIGQEWICRPIPAGDHVYRGMLRDVYTSGMCRLSVADMPASSLREAYERAGLAALVVVMVWDGDGQFFYMAASSKEADFGLDGSDIAVVQGAAAQIRPLLTRPL